MKKHMEPISDSGTDNKKMKRSAIAMESAEKAVSEALPSTSKPLFDAYEEAIEQYVLDSSEQAFFDGFCIGLRIAVEVYTEAAQGA
ncbi:MAG: DUF6809 family protein [Acutalibacteraceae bacterium]